MPALQPPPARPIPAAPLLNTRLALAQALTTVVERVEVTHKHFAVVSHHHHGNLISDAELAHVRTLALALMCRFCDDARAGLGARLERLVFPDDTRITATTTNNNNTAPERAETNVLPVLTDAVVTDETEAEAEAETMPADFDETLQLDTLHLAAHPAWRG